MDVTGKALWRTDLPDRMTQYQAGLDDRDMAVIQQYPRDAAAHLSFLCGILYLGNRVVIGDCSGLLVLDRRNGSVVMDYGDEHAEQGDYLFFDKGTYTITDEDGKTWKGATRRASFLAPMGKRLMFFNGYTMAAFSTNPWKLTTAIQYKESLYRIPSPPVRTTVRFTIDGIDVLLQGITYLR